VSAAFEFRFQKVLDLRGQQERALEIELARADATLQQARDRLARWQDARDQGLAALAEARCKADLEEAGRQSRYLEYVRSRIERARADIAELERQREGVRRRLERVMQSRKMLEGYRERQLGEFMAAQEKAEERIVELHSVFKFHQAKRAQ